MKFSAVIILIIMVLALQPPFLNAAEYKPHAFRARVSAAVSDTYADTDLEEELNFGREVAARMLGQYKMSRNDRLQKYVNLVGLTLARHCSRPELDFHVVVVESDEINAYSTPGGYVFVTTSLLAEMENEAELAGVLAHEIAHVTQRHIVKELNLRGAEKSPISSLAALIGGATETAGIAFSQAVDRAVDLILRDGYRIEDEMQADATAVLLCAVSGYDPSGLVTLLNRISAIKSGVGKTYPLYDVRLMTLQQVISEEGISGMSLALNTERFITAMKAGKSNPFNLIRTLTPGGTHE